MPGRSLDGIAVRFRRPLFSLFSPTGSANYPQGASSGRSQRTGLSRPTVILTQTALKGKGQNDVSLVSGRLCEGWSVRSQACPALPMQAVRQALQ